MKRYLLPILLIATLLAPSGAAQRGPTTLAASGQLAPQTAPPAQPRYTITDLGTLGGPMSQGMGINKNSQVVGASQSGSYMHAFLWDDGTMTNLGALGMHGSWAYDINDAGQVVGGSYVGDTFESHAFLWQNGGMQDLGTLGGPVSFAFEINNAGQAVGSALNDEGIQHAVLWGNGGIVDLGDLDPLWPNHSGAYGINDAGQVVGSSGTDIPGQSHAFLWQNGSMQDLGTLGGDTSQAIAINTDSQVVGSSGLSDQTTIRAFLWQNGSLQNLGALGWTHSRAYDINDAGQVVGELQTAQTYHAFLWANNQMQDLNDLIPADSGWVLQSARAINKRGQIVGYGGSNGQTRAFLLTPQAYYWTNPSGGSWHVTTNWDPQGDPGDGDTVIFALSGQYAVNAGPVFAASAPTVNFPVGRMVISGTNTVDFNNLSLNLLNDSAEEPALTVNDGGTVKIISGAGAFIHAVIGGLLPANPNNPPTARLQVFNSGTRLTGSGRLTIGDLGVGDLFVANGGRLTSAEARLGGALPGTAAVGGDGSLWQTGSIAVGYGVSGTLTIENGGRVDSNIADVGFGSASNDSQVTVDGVYPGSNQSSLWAISGDLTIGQGAYGSIEVLNGGDLFVNQDVHITNGELYLEGRLSNGNASDLDVLGSVFVGGPGRLALRNAAQGDIDGDLIVGKDGIGFVILSSDASVMLRSELNVINPQAGLCAIGREFYGMLLIGEEVMHCRNMRLGQAGTLGTGFLSLDGGILYVMEVLRVGEDGSGGGQVDLHNALIMTGQGVYIAPNGEVTGTGTIAVGFLGLQNEGTLSPGITVLPLLAPAITYQSTAQAEDGAATLAITGTLTTGPTGRLEIPLTGSSAGQYGSLAVTGAANLDGVLALNFSNGYAPHQGDTFTFLTATGGISGAFDSVAISGLPPGFEYELSTVDGQVVLEALNDGAHPGMVFLPLVMH